MGILIRVTAERRVLVQCRPAAVMAPYFITMSYLYMRNNFTGLGHGLGFRDPSMDTWEYICNQSPSEALKTVRFHVWTKVLGLANGVRPHPKSGAPKFASFARY